MKVFFPPKTIPTNINKECILCLHAINDQYNLRWISVQMAFLLSKNHSNLTEVKWMYFLSHNKSKKKNTVIHSINSFIRFRVLSSCHQMCVRNVETDSPQRHRYVAYWSLKDLVTFVTFVFVFAQFMSYSTCMTWINCNVTCVTWTMKRYVLLILKNWDAEIQCTTLKTNKTKGISFTVIVFCIVPWNWPCHLYPYPF